MIVEEVLQQGDGLLPPVGLDIKLGELRQELVVLGIKAVAACGVIECRIEFLPAGMKFVEQTQGFTVLRVVLQGVPRRYGGKVGLIGPNASGKSTLIRIVLGLLRSEGELLLDGEGRRGAEQSSRIAYVPQIAPKFGASICPPSLPIR